MLKKLLFWTVVLATVFYIWQQPEFHSYKQRIINEIMGIATETTSQSKKPAARDLVNRFSHKMKDWPSEEQYHLKFITRSTDALVHFENKYCRERILYHPVFPDDKLIEICSEAKKIIKLLILN
ncbi:hypothetical protein [Catenovulum sediminis]|uniref:hypothetical protein n=1 Tax=Catenovulum sediminis TaxID=1740262 RepID=UPI00117C9C01|nr:hypothetical protein [Catenovulum sediminis]